MSKIKNDGLTRSGTGCFIAVYPCDNSGRQRVKTRYRHEIIRQTDRRTYCGHLAYGGKIERITIGMLTDIRINPDNLLSGYTRIINYPFNYPSIWLLTLFMYLFMYFVKLFTLVSKILHISTSISKIFVVGLEQ